MRFNLRRWPPITQRHWRKISLTACGESRDPAWPRRDGNPYTEQHGMGKRPAARQASRCGWTRRTCRPSDGHPFFERLNRVLADSGFDAFVEGCARSFTRTRLGRPSLRPGRYFRMLFIGYFEGLSSERGIAWRVADSLSLRSFLDLELTEAAPDHSTPVAHAGGGSTWRPTRRCSRGFWSGCRRRVWFGGRRWASMRRRWKRTRRCGASSGGTRGNPTTRSFSGWRKRPGWRRRRGPSWLGSTGLGRTRRRRQGVEIAAGP